MEPLEGASTLEQFMMQTAVKKRTPINGSLELLPLCNMNCDMCYVRLSHEEMEANGRIRTADEWLDIARQMQKAGVLFLLLTGGEPLLYPEFEKLYLGLKKLGMILTINTNGTLIDEHFAEFLGTHKPRRVNITLYGASTATYSSLCHYPEGFEKAMHGISLLKKHNVDIKLSSSLTKANQQDIGKLLLLEKELNIPVRIDTYMLPATRERMAPYDLDARVNPETAAKIRISSLKEEMGKETFEAYRQGILSSVREAPDGPKAPLPMSCYAGKCSFSINWQGEMRPCVIMTRPAISVFESGFDAAWKYITEETDKIYLSPSCSTCRLRSVCRTCAACALLEAGSYESIPEYMCRYAAESLKQLSKDFS